jgi:hypothetical protein
MRVISASNPAASISCLLLGLFMLTSSSNSTSAQETSLDRDPNIKRSQASVRKLATVHETGEHDRADFSFDLRESEGWIGRGGEWQLRTWVKHSGLRCATYAVGIRVGAGDPGCTDVRWTTEAQFGSSQLQCNSARVQHTAAGRLQMPINAYDSMTCVERLIHCEGNCK